MSVPSAWLLAALMIPVAVPAIAGEADDRVDVAAYYFPGYHRDSRGGDSPEVGEWGAIAKARPRFPGHLQPKACAWGAYDSADPAWAAKEIDLAADHGITSFIYDWYANKGGHYLKDQLERGFLAAPNRARLDFGLMWCNHDVWGEPGKVSREVFDEQVVDYVIAHYFPQPNYWRIDGAPYFSIYELHTFVDGLGGLDQARAALDGFRAKAAAAGFPSLHLNAVDCFSSWRPDLMKPEVLRSLGISSLTSYCYIHHYPPASFPREEFRHAAEANWGRWESVLESGGIPYHPNVSMGWDSSPRCAQDQPYESGKGYPWMTIFVDNTPELFAEGLRRAKSFVAVEGRQRVVTLNAWNEWAEGSYLAPDTVTGTRYLEGIREVFGVRKR
jgi:hypothetical protein